MLERIRRLVPVVLLGLAVSPALHAQGPERGISISVSGSGFVAGESGPTVVPAPIHPETGFEDTFGTGVGISAQYFRQMGAAFRWQVGLIHRRWPGQYFEGGEFQPGWQFGAAGRFDDLALTGAYAGVSVIRPPGPKLRPFASLDLAVVRISELNVTVSGDSEQYWKSATKDFLVLKGGITYRVSDRTAVLIHAGASILGQPDSVDVFAGATAGTAADVGIGIDYTF